MIDQSNERAEVSLCGEILNWGTEAWKRVPDYLMPEDFGITACKRVFEAAQALHREGIPLTPVNIHRKVEDLGGVIIQEDVDSMRSNGYAPHEVPEYAKLIHQAGLRRLLNQMCANTTLDCTTPLEQLVYLMEFQLEDIKSRVVGSPIACAASEVEYMEPKWLLKPYFQLGKGTLVQADPGVGKTAFMCAVAACVSRGTPLLGLPVQNPGKVVILSAEDDPGVLRGRLEASGADLNQVLLVKDPYKLTFASPEIERLLNEHHPKLLIFDPLQAFMGAKVDMFRANETRPILMGLFDLCAKYECACVIIAHLGKSSTGKSAVNQSLGSVDIPGAMRSILHIVRHPEKEQLMAVHIKSSNAARGKTIAYSIGERGGVHWLELTEDTLEDLNGTRQEERIDAYDTNILLPVIRYMNENNHSNCFWSYEEVRDLCLKLLQYQPFKNARELTSYMTPAFLKELEQREGIMVKLAERFNAKRGLRVLPLPGTGEGCGDPLPPTPEEYEELMNLLNQQEPSDY